jgi:hypothetical protein
MSRNGINGGLRQGWLQGVKSGMGFAKMDGGLKKGIVSESGMHNRVQDPTLFLGSKKPSAFFLADFATATGAGANISALQQLIPGATTFVLNSGVVWQPPYRGNGGVYNNRAYLDFNNTADAVYTNSSTMGSGKNEFTLMMVFRVSTASQAALFCSIDSTFSLTIGDLVVETYGDNVRVTFTGNPTTTSSVYDTYDPTLQVGNHWHLLTVKARLYQPNGPGSEMEIWLNGKKDMTPVTTTFGASTGNFIGNTFVFGAYGQSVAGGFSRGGSNIAGAITFDYWLNPSEQIRMENYFRWYYGRRF